MTSRSKPRDVQDFARRDPATVSRRACAMGRCSTRCIGCRSSVLRAGVRGRDAGVGRFVPTGSANFALLQSLGQSLAGANGTARAAAPSARGGRAAFPIRRPIAPRPSCSAARFQPPTIAVSTPDDWYPSYVATYVERDVATIINIGDLVGVPDVLRLLAGRSGQRDVNLSSLGADAGLTHRHGEVVAFGARGRVRRRGACRRSTRTSRNAS